MMQLEQILGFFPPTLRDNSSHRKYLLKEYIQLLILDFLSKSSYISRITFIGGTNLRLVKGIDRFSEDLDFDCKDFSELEFLEMTDEIVKYLNRSGIVAATVDKPNSRLIAMRRNIVFPGLLQSLHLSGHKDEKFLIKIECQDQHIQYNVVQAAIKGCGFYFPFPVPPDPVLLSMKLSALLSRRKGRDFYDVIFLSSMTKPDYDFLKRKAAVANAHELSNALSEALNQTNLAQKTRDFEHLLFEKRNAQRILDFEQLVLRGFENS